MTTKLGVLRPLRHRGPLGAPDAGSPMTKDRSWLANVKRSRRLAREERLEWIERLQRLERRKRQSGEYVPDRRNPPYWL